MRIFGYLVLLTWTFCSFQQTGRLDLVTELVQGREREPTTASATAGGVGGGDGAVFHRGAQPLESTISAVEGMENKAGVTLIYEVRLVNRSDRTVKIPWKASPRDIEPSKPGPYEYKMASLAPRFVNASGQSEALEPALIYGSDAPSTMREVGPGQSVTIRAKTRLNSLRSGDLASFLSIKQNSVNLSVLWSLYQVSFTEQNGQYHETFVLTEEENPSTNTMPIHLGSQAGGSPSTR